jgi:hypothetical protein
MASRKHQAPTPSEIAAQAIESRDGILISELLKQVAFSTAPREERSEALQRIALHHTQMTHVVVGILSTLSMIDTEAAKRVAHVVLSERPDHERDVVYAAAARVLIEVQPVDSKDLAVIARCASSSFDAVRGEVIRAIDNLPHFIAATVSESARASEQTPAMKKLVSLLDQRIALRRSVLPALPRATRTIEDDIIVDDEVPVREKRSRTVKPPPRKPAPRPIVSSPRKPPSEAPALPQRESSPLSEEPARPSEELPTAKTTANHPSLTSEQRSFLTTLTSQEAKDLSDVHLVIHIAQEREPQKLLSLLCELTLRHGKKVRDEHMSRFVWLTSTPFGAGNEDIRALIKLLFTEE